MAPNSPRANKRAIEKTARKQGVLRQGDLFDQHLEERLPEPQEPQEPETLLTHLRVCSCLHVAITDCCFDKWHLYVLCGCYRSWGVSVPESELTSVLQAISD